MYLIQIFLPVRDDRGRRYPNSRHQALSTQLTERFGGVTRYSQAPAKGLWKPAGRRAERDDLVVYEVMAPTLQRRWWISTRRRLERELRQEEILIRAMRITRL